MGVDQGGGGDLPPLTFDDIEVGDPVSLNGLSAIVLSKNAKYIKTTRFVSDRADLYNKDIGMILNKKAVGKLGQAVRPPKDEG